MKLIFFVMLFFTCLELSAQPTAVNDTLYIAVNDSVEVNLLKNDSGDNIKISSVNLQGTNGTVSINEGDTILTYIAPMNYDGFDRFIYEITDSFGLTSSAEVLINVIPGLSADYNTIALYKFEEKQTGQSFDYSYNGNHGIDFGTEITEGVTGNCRYFDGIDDKINMDAVRLSLIPATQWTIEFIARAVADSIDPPGLINHACGNGWVLQPQRKGISYGIKTAGAGGCLWMGNGWQYVPTDSNGLEWHYFAATYSANDSLRIFRDGIQVSRQFASGNFQYNQGHNFKAFIGHNDFGNDFYEGYIDEIRVSKIAKTPEEIKATFQLLNTYLGLQTTGVTEESKTTPEGFSLHQNYPNPFNPTTTLSYTISKPSFVSLKVYDVLGNEIASLVNEYKQAGNYKVEFNAEGLASGIYFYKIKADVFNQVKKMIYLR